MCRVREPDVMLVVQFFHRIREVDLVDIERLHRVDRVDVGVDGPRLHLQMGAVSLRYVAQPADDDVSASVR